MFIYYTYMGVNQSYGTITNEESDAKVMGYPAW